MTSEREQKYADMLKAMVLASFADEPCRIFLFGSRARGTARRSSDYDIGFTSISRDKLVRKTAVLNAMIEESIIPHSVDWVLFDETDPSFRMIAEEDVIIWKK